MSGVQKRKRAEAILNRARLYARKRGTTAANMDVVPTPIRNTFGSGGFSTGFGVGSRGMPPYRQSELKSVDVNGISLTFDATGNFQVLNIPVTGAAFYNRIGNEIMMKSLHLIGQLTLTNNVATSNEYLRLMVIYDRQPNGAMPATADVITSYNTAGTTSSLVKDHLNPNNFDRFKILMDNRVHIPLDTTGAVSKNDSAITDYTKNEVNINRFIKLRGLSTKYKASAAAIGDITSGSLLLFAFGNIANATAAYSFNGTARLRFVD